ncbi:BA75_01602T0 [Komagataella pastoris]|uniref:BA75_01602T0 n=1 Tax=Komagataella pastoris TaxID=4922 RepID=A0A1B2JA80_PICPA|nr:BA75_01602T0 [Komagataella pastoris]
MKLFFVGIVTTLLTLVSCLKIENGIVSVGQEEFAFGTKSIPLYRNQDIKVEFNLKADQGKLPQQIALSLDTESASEVVYPKLSGSKAQFTISVKQLSGVIKSQPFDLTLIVGDIDPSNNLQQFIASISPVEKLTNYESPVRLGAKEEIKHIFRQQEPTVPAGLSLIFISVIGAILAGLLITWTVSDSYNLKNFPSSSCQKIWHILFLGSIVGLEGIFVQYYLGSSIFDTLFKASIAGSVSLVAGSRALRR